MDFGYRAVLAGAGLARGWKVGPVALFTGPRVAALWLGRSFNLGLYQGTQDYLTLAPGWVGVASWRVLGRLEGTGVLARAEGVLFKRGAYDFASLAHDDDAIADIEHAASTAFVALREEELAGA